MIQGFEPITQLSGVQRRVEELRWRASTLEDEDDVRRMLFASFEDTYPPVRHMAARLLGQRLDAQSIKVLNHLVQQAPAIQAHAAALALSDVSSKDPAAEAALLRGTEREDSDVRYQSLVSLFAIDASDDVLRPLMCRLLNDSDKEVVIVAAQITGARGYVEYFSSLVARRRTLRGFDRTHFALAISELLAQKPSLGTPDLVHEVFKDLEHALKREQTVAAAARALATFAQNTATHEIHASRARQVLRAVLKKWFLHPILKVEAAAALVSLRDAVGEEFLVDQFASRHKGAKGYAIETAGRLGLTQFLDIIMAIANSMDFHNETAVIALGHYMALEPARKALMHIEQLHTDADVRALAGEVLRGEVEVFGRTCS